MDKKNHLFDDSIKEKLDDLKKEKPEPVKKSWVRKLPAIIIAGVMTISILLRFFL